MSSRRLLRHALRRQHGVTLLVTMIMLVVLTLFVVSAIRLANTNLRITGNYQWQKETEMMADSALEQLISNVANFTDSTVQAGTAADKDICTDGTVVASGGCSTLNPSVGTVSKPLCTASRPATNYTKKLGELAPDDNDWIVKAQITDPFSGARVTIYRGVTVRMLAGNCPS